MVFLALVNIERMFEHHHNNSVCLNIDVKKSQNASLMRYHYNRFLLVVTV